MCRNVNMEESASKFCGICQIQIQEGIQFHLLNNNNKPKLLEVLPKIHPKLTQKSVTCRDCMTQFTNTQEFKPLQEGTINTISQAVVAFSHIKKEPESEVPNYIDKIKEERQMSDVQESNPTNKLLLENVRHVKPDAEWTTNRTEEVLFNDNSNWVEEKIKEEFSGGVIKDEVSDLQVKYTYNNGTDRKPFQSIDDYKCNKDEYIITEKSFCITDYNYRSTMSSDFKTHVRKPTAKTPYQCDECGYKCAYKSTLQTHKLRHTNAKPFRCTDCNYSSTKSSTLKNHIRTHTGEKPYQCEECGYKCGNKRSLEYHKLSHTSEKPFRCTECNYSCTQSTHLKTHMRKHTGEKPYQCDKCDYKCAYLQSFKDHKLSHSNEKPFKCTECNYRCTRATHLKDHMYRHTGEKPYQCDKCDYKCSLKTSLKEHILSHANGKVFMCSECSYGSCRSSDFKTHMKKHTYLKKPIISCERCDFKTLRQFDLRNHKITCKGCDNGTSKA